MLTVPDLKLVKRRLGVDLFAIEDVAAWAQENEDTLHEVIGVFSSGATPRSRLLFKLYRGAPGLFLTDLLELLAELYPAKRPAGAGDAPAEQLDADPLDGCADERSPGHAEGDLDTDVRSAAIGQENPLI